MQRNTKIKPENLKLKTTSNYVLQPEPFAFQAQRGLLPLRFIVVFDVLI
jgi:hypothetical protein